MDYNSGDVLAGSKFDEHMEPASLTKLMTAYVVFDELKRGDIKLTDQVTVSEKAWRMEGSRMFIEVGKKVPVDKLLDGMIVQSGNDATVALAEYVAGDESTFSTLMNNHAEALGLKNTHYINSTGLPHKDHYTSAHDLALLGAALIRDFPEYYDRFSIKRYVYNGINQYNRNKLLWRDKYVDGIKTGHTDSAGYCLVSSALKDGMRLISVVMGTKSEEARARESQKLLNFGFRFYETHQLYAAGKPLTQARVWKGAKDNVALGLRKPLYVTIPRGRYDDLQASMSLHSQITAPLSRGQTFGSVSVTLDGVNLDSRPLVALQDVAEGDIFDRLTDEFLLLFE